MEEELEFLENNSTAQDNPKNTDYLFGDMFEFAGDIKSSMLYNNTPILNQRNTMRCTVYSPAKANNEQNFTDSKVYINPDDLIPKAIERGLSETQGWGIQDALDLFREQKLISGYSRVWTIDEIKQAIYQGKLICTGTKHCNWIETHKTKTFTYKENSTGHAFCIIGYNETSLIAANSYTTQFGDNGKFYIPYNSLKYLFTCYAISDYKDKEIFINKKIMEDTKLLEEAKTIGVWNGLEPKKQATRDEVVLMIMRALKNKS